nr:hypothetical protein [uncultured bacterium]
MIVSGSFPGCRIRRMTCRLARNEVFGRASVAANWSLVDRFGCAALMRVSLETLLVSACGVVSIQPLVIPMALALHGCDQPVVEIIDRP